jgi:O-antigen ligase
VFGVGPDNYRLLYGNYAGLVPADPRVHSNNMYLEVLAGGGLVGGLAFAWLLWRAARGLLDAVRRAATPHEAMAVAGIAAACAAIALHGALDSFLSFTPTYVLIAVTLALASTCGASQTEHANRV